MKKIEQVYREILYQSMEKGKKALTQSELSKKLEISLSVVNFALKKLVKMNAIKINKMNFVVIDMKKILYLWASERNLEKDIVYSVRIEMPIRDIEKNLPDVTYGTYSAFKFKFHDVPADYSEVYVYADEKELEEIKKRAKGKEKAPNLFVLKKDENMSKYSKTGTIGQIFVDLWNLKQWYASDFLKELNKKLNLHE